MNNLTLYQQVIHKTRYAKYKDDVKRRESWEETVDRYVNFISDIKSQGDFDYTFERMYPEDVSKIRNAILNMEVMPSMRLLMTAGEAVKRDNLCAFNCSYLAIDNKRAFSEVLYILMQGTGVGFSCERQYINKLPIVPEELRDVQDTIVVGDSKLGWAKAFKKLLSSLWEGDVPQIDYSDVRPAGARLKTFGGRASGPEPLKKLFNFCIETFYKARGRKLNSIEVHDIVCTIGEVIVVGGVRRSALISLSNLTDRRMREAKTGAWWEDNPQRALANNSVCYTEKPDMDTFMEEWLALIKSKSGERGVFNRVAAQKQAAKNGLRDPKADYGTNPCSEIILKNKELCNLSEVVVRSDDTFETLKEKVRIATLIGTLQSTLTDFKFVSPEWITNCNLERLLGVSLTGIMDHEVLNGNKGPEVLKEWLTNLKDYAREVNDDLSTNMGIPTSAGITVVKPSGTVAQLTNAGTGGIHPRYSKYYVRSIRQDNKDPLTQLLKDSGVYNEPAHGREDSTTVFYFPIESPDGSVFRDDRTALEQLEHWKVYQEYWCEHKPSVTVYVRDEEWLEVGAWVYKNFDMVSGVSFLPHTDHSYKQAPFEECTRQKFEELELLSPSSIDWDSFQEQTDLTVGSQELACTGDNCII